MSFGLGNNNEEDSWPGAGDDYIQERARANMYESALKAIADELGAVCANFEICTHKSCRDSCSANLAAKAALDGSWNYKKWKSNE